MTAVGLLSVVITLFVVVGAGADETTCAAGTCAGDSKALPGIEFAYMWTTPFMTVRPSFANKKFNQGLSSHATAAFEAFKKKLMESKVVDSNSFVTISEKFFQWQRDNFNKLEAEGVPDPEFLVLYKSDEYTSLRKLVVKYASQYLQRLDREEKVEHIFCWVGLTLEGMYHLSHTHPDSMLSAVYYSQTPPSSGAIVFDDPRGPRPPFDGKLMHAVKTGELLVFPSWLVHEVIPTQGEIPRIAFACNMKGAWETTTDVSLRGD